MTTLEKLKADNGGTLPAFAWPGGYQMIYVASDGGVFCPDCANGKNGSDARLSDGPDDAPHDGWLLEGYDVFYEGPDEYCAHCNAVIESVYGDPDAPYAPKEVK